MISIKAAENSTTNYLNSSAISIEINKKMDELGLTGLKELYKSEVSLFNKFFHEFSEMMNDIKILTALAKKATLAKQSSEPQILGLQTAFYKIAQDLSLKEQDGVFSSAVSAFKQLQLDFNTEKNKIEFLENHNFPLIPSDDVKFFLCFKDLPDQYASLLKQLTKYLKSLPKIGPHIASKNKKTREDIFFMAFANHISNNTQNPTQNPFVQEEPIQTSKKTNEILLEHTKILKDFIQNI